MANECASPQPHRPETTFKQYTPEQAQSYLAGRKSYGSKIFDIILQHHRDTGGAFDTLVDVGCGPGHNSTRPLARHFATAYGLDASPGMLQTARMLGGETASGKAIEYLEGSAEDLEPLRARGIRVDLLTAALAAHWFDMPRFWARAASMVKSGGTVALWIISRVHLHPDTPNAKVIEERMRGLRSELLAPYEVPGNRIARGLYDKLGLPWECEPVVEGFSTEGFTRIERNRDGLVDEGGSFWLGDERVSIGQLTAAFSTGSSVTRWREAHRDLVGTKEDVVRRIEQELRELIRDEELKVGASCALLLFKRN